MILILGLVCFYMSWTTTRTAGATIFPSLNEQISNYFLYLIEGCLGPTLILLSIVLLLRNIPIKWGKNIFLLERF